MTQPALRRTSEPFSNLFLSHLYRAAPGQVAPLVADLAPSLRVQLAIFCFSRAHLRSIGREIAAACDEIDLQRYAPGAIGACLREAKRAASADDDGAAGPGRRPRVTLATAADMRRKMPVMPVPDDDVEIESDEDGSDAA